MGGGFGEPVAGYDAEDVVLAVEPMKRNSKGERTLDLIHIRLLKNYLY